MSQLDYASLPVYDSAEIVVCGGGTAGAFAAIAAANEGKDVLVIEQFGMLGGSATAGLVTPLMNSLVPGDPPCSYLAEEVRKRLLSLGACNETGRSFDVMMLKVVLEQMCVEAGVRLLYHTFIPDVIVKDGKVEAVVIANKGGLSLIKGKIFIDCTGDGDVCVRAGAEYTQGHPQTGKNQPMSLRYIVDHVDTLALREFFEEKKKETGLLQDAWVAEDGIDLYVSCGPGTPCTLNSVFEEAIANGDLLEEDYLYWQGFYMPGRPGCIAFNCPEFFDHIDGTNPQDLTRAQIEGKQRILRHLQFYRKYFRGFEKAYISEIAALVGVRESREIATDYILQGTDLYAKRKFPDMVYQSNYPIDVHGRVLSNEYLPDVEDDGMPWYDIPYRSLVVKGFDNLLVAGRCIGADFLAEASVRVQQNARATGEATGIAAAMALNQGITPHEIDGAKVRARMIERGARYASKAE